MYDLINLTLPKVIRAIDEVLEDYPENPYQSAFAIHPIRQKLIAHILSLVPNAYTVEGELRPFMNLSRVHISPVAERLHLEMIVRGSILHILREGFDLGTGFVGWGKSLESLDLLTHDNSRT
ncbi:MAG: hypothetical protein WA949_06225 [Phormidesmis sp.]